WYSIFSKAFIEPLGNPAFQFAYQLQSLRFTATERRTRLSQLQIAETRMRQKLKRLVDSRLRSEKIRCFLDRHFWNVAHALFVEADFQGLRIEAFTPTSFARNVT